MYAARRRTHPSPQLVPLAKDHTFPLATGWDASPATDPSGLLRGLDIRGGSIHRQVHCLPSEAGQPACDAHPHRSAQPMTRPREGTIPLPAGTTGACWMISPRSYLLSRFTPSVEDVRVPPSRAAGGTLRYALGPRLAEPQRARTPRIGGLLGKPKPRRIPGQGISVDLRRNTPGNWAHILTNHLPYVFALAEETGVDWSELTLLLPAGTPSHIRAAVDIFGLRSHCTDEAVEGPGIAFEPDPWQGLRHIRAQWAKASPCGQRLRRPGSTTHPTDRCPAGSF